MSRRPRVMTRAALFAAALLACAVGCSGRQYAEVEGTVTLDGKPLPDVKVIFVPDPTKGNSGNNATAYTDAAGRYRLQSERDGRDGAVLGRHRVLIIDVAAIPDITPAGAPGGAAQPRPQQPREFRVPGSYGDTAQTPFNDIEVKAGKQTLDFDVKSKGP